MKPRLLSHSIELLEPRIAPALVIAASGRSATYTDRDGDLVTVAVTKGKLVAANFTLVNSGVGQQLQELDLHAPGAGQVPAFTGSAVTITAKPGPLGGDGLAAVGFIDGAMVDLGAVKVDGDLGRIEAGAPGVSTKAAVLSLTVQSLGRLELTTQAAGGSPESEINGKLGALTIKTDLYHAILEVQGDASAGIGPVTIGGSIIGGAVAGSGSLYSAGKIGAIKVAGDLVGGSAVSSGTVQALGVVTSVRVGGSFLGGTADYSGDLITRDGLGAVTIGGQLRGSGGAASGSILALGPLKSVTVARDVIGGSGTASGSIVSIVSAEAGAPTTAPIGAVTIRGSLIGGSHPFTGILADGTLGAVKITGDVRGASATSTAKIMAKGLLDQTTAKAATAILSVSIGGSVRFGEILAGYSLSSNDSTKVVASNADAQLGAVTITGDFEASSIAAGAVAGSDGFGNASDQRAAAGDTVALLSRIASITIKGALYGTTAAGDHFGFVADQIGKIQIGKGIPAVGNGRPLAPVTDDFRIRLLA